ncbi:uncharacterized protein HMPREF1120_07382 [Exophiala dermatitidis NIH/UT8656]|uniref:Uncharacterized protein n=1 Tax=Exophiala dermatitidis (strain ATCC 34100 / CBS 525.76 / NIH/UT8656) TaxID=858893 RepID=H6C6P6_EXODN|nr:uncharacterized protein HMPREF1120_07382 [Exophiala dermatitidis NIH/UT8656]EHY59392.1 hypothetical protein HMPREF1120_07382 [Exophiala dermatitidis NIH/UT8656]
MALGRAGKGCSRVFKKKQPLPFLRRNRKNNSGWRYKSAGGRGIVKYPAFCPFLSPLDVVFLFSQDVVWGTWRRRCLELVLLKETIKEISHMRSHEGGESQPFACRRNAWDPLLLTYLLPCPRQIPVLILQFHEWKMLTMPTR